MASRGLGREFTTDDSMRMVLCQVRLQNSTDSNGNWRTKAKKRSDLTRRHGVRTGVMGRKKDARWGIVQGAHDRWRWRRRPKVTLKRDPAQSGDSHLEKGLL